MCPKCKAKIGLVQERINCDTGQTSGRICYMCGFWIQDTPRATENDCKRN